ncbi:DUF2570 family protein [Actinobacillus pleuropneumoniae]|uniref:DUF2570 family protein n=1 Tax=Actinobacillus pleuropneumoniae TaxID=715 RepID=UPI001F3E267A|nr:DUF2570 family protein [Actinobacillus pleuropneumoniae]UKH19901.1 DUF2570 domain-containing protein [Actinobacillus pleuropneumoniae]UPA21715.1 DUF2570 domain-containing protein [Actinobacillus pleuropneumoniae]
MLDGFTKAMGLLVGGLALLVVALGGWSLYQSSKIDTLNAEVKAKDSLIAEQQAVNQELITQLETEKQAVEYQQKITNELKAQMETERENVKTILIKEPCGGVAMPSAVIDSIKRLHTKGSNKN